MKELSECPICKSVALYPATVVPSSPVMNIEVEAIRFPVASYVSYLQCQMCGTVCQSPRMDDEHVEMYYRNGTYRKWMAASPESLDEDEKNRADVDAKLIRNAVGNVDSHLDIGASKGYLLNSVGASVKVGVEPYESYRDGDGNIHWISSLGESSRSKFQMVSAIHVLEHVVDPMSLLEQMKRSMWSDGYLIIEVPSNSSPGGWGRLAHLYHFPPWSLHWMAGQLEMKIVDMRFTPHLFSVWRFI